MPRITNIQQRGGTAAQWTSANPVLAAREIGLELDTLKMKVGNGSANWNSLPYLIATDQDVSNYWKSPYFLPSTNGANGLGTIYSGAEIIPAGNAAQLASRDHIGLDKYPVMPGEKYIIEFTGKSILGGTLIPNVGVWMYTAAGAAGASATHGWNAYDSATGAPTKIADLANGFARYRRVHTMPNTAGMAASATPPRLGSLYFQLSQFSPYTDAYIVSDVSMRRVALDQEIDTVSGSKVTGLTKTSVGLANVDNTADTAKPVSTAQQTALNGKENSIAAGTTAQYWRGDKSWQTLNSAAVGLGSVNNTSDAAKPISTATQAALDGKAASRRNTAAGWNTANTVLGAGEMGQETDTGLFKIGDGVKAWKALGYYNGKPFDMTVMSDDIATEVDFDVNAVSAPLGERLNIPTHVSPAGGQTNHPSVLFFPDGWGAPGKWKYWMAHTPYPAGNDDHEDPNIVVSNNGISWQAPAGLTNPLDDASGQPEFNSDVDLKMGADGTMYLFWRFYDTNNVGNEEQLWYRSTTDGINWTPKVRYWINDVSVRKPLSPSLIFEDGAWTMWYVDAVPSPNVVMRMRSNGPAPESGWQTPTAVNGMYYAPGKEPWHIGMLKQGGKYYGLLNDCLLDQNGADGALLFIKSYDGTNFECATQSCVPKTFAGEHTRLYRSCMVPAVQDGQPGFRIWYVGWRDGPVWNIYRSFLSHANAFSGTDTAVPVAYDAPISPTYWNNSGDFMLTVTGAKAKIEFDLTLARSATAPDFPINNVFTSMGTIIPQGMRVKTDTVSRYYDGWLSGSGFNLPVQLFINWYSGVMMIRQQSGATVQVSAGVFAQLTGNLIIDDDLLFSLPTGPYPEPKVVHAHPNATITSDGFLSSADKVKLDGATALATASTLVLRDANGNLAAAVPVASADVATKGYVDSQFASGGTTVAAPLAVTNWTNTGAVSKKNNGTYTQFDLDLVLTRAPASPNFSVANAFVSCGIVIPTAMRSNNAGDVRYYPGWIAGGGFNLPVQTFVNMNTGEVMVRQQSGTAVNLVAGCAIYIAHPMHLLTANLP